MLKIAKLFQNSSLICGLTQLKKKKLFIIQNNVAIFNNFYEIKNQKSCEMIRLNIQKNICFRKKNLIYLYFILNSTPSEGCTHQYDKKFNSINKIKIIVYRRIIIKFKLKFLNSILISPPLNTSNSTRLSYVCAYGQTQKNTECNSIKHRFLFSYIFFFGISKHFCNFLQKFSNLNLTKKDFICCTDCFQSPTVFFISPLDRHNANTHTWSYVL